MHTPFLGPHHVSLCSVSSRTYLSPFTKDNRGPPSTQSRTTFWALLGVFLLSEPRTCCVPWVLLLFQNLDDLQRLCCNAFGLRGLGEVFGVYPNKYGMVGVWHCEWDGGPLYRAVSLVVDTCTCFGQPIWFHRGPLGPHRWHTFSAFWLRSSVVSVPISSISDMLNTVKLEIKLIS